MEQYSVTGMSCAACSARVEKAVRAVPGVSSCAVSLLTGSMGVEGTADPAAIIHAVEAAGYGASKKGAAAPAPAADTLADHESPRLLRRLLFSLGFLLALMYLSMGHQMWGLPLPAPLAESPVALGLLQLLLAAAVMIVNQRFFISGSRALLHRSPNMDTLVSLGSAAAFVYSTCALILMAIREAAGDTAAVMELLHGLYFESAAMILALITVGKLLEAHSKGRTTNALRSLMALAPETACVLREGEERTVPVGELHAGEIFVVRPGEKIPADGIVTEGSSAVDEAALTGESIPAEKSPGNAVHAATVNRSGYLRCRATQVGEDTALSQIIRMVSDAAATKAPIARLADRVSGVFVPVVIAIAALTTLIWLLCHAGIGFALSRGISVLVISCPCALGLATPVAIMVGNGVGAKNGILFKSAVALESAGRLQTVALDKTGTITRGEPAVTDLLPAEGTSEEELLLAAYRLEKMSEHPLSGAIRREAERRGLSADAVEQLQIHPGSGLSGSDHGEELVGGSLAFLESRGELPEVLRTTAATLAAAGKTPLFFSKNGTLLGLIAVADVLKEDSPAAIQELRQMGLRVVMLTGDNRATAEAIGRAAGVDEVRAGLLPGDKERAIRELRESGRVAMVGDGINDAPALTAADVGIAIGAGTDVAIDAADIVLMNSRLSDVPAAVRLSRRTLVNIRENLFWAFFYNAIGIPLAAGVFIPLLGWELNPMFGAAAMSLSSFCVVTNALRLSFLRIHNSRHDRKRKNKMKNKKEITTMKKTMKIEGMMCTHCEARVKKLLEGIPGVASAEVSHTVGTAILTLSAEVSDETLRKAVEDEGYTVKA